MHAQLLGRLYGVGKHAIVRNGSQMSGQAERITVAGVRGRGHGDYHVPHMHLVHQAAGGTNSDDGVHVKLGVQLGGIEPHGGNAHAAAHHGDFLPLVSAGIA